jgi:hypothetical protein
MLDYGSFCYLQNQKTGGTFVEKFLRKFSQPPLQAYKKHASLQERVPGKFYFTNVREPLALYQSLYAYGLEGKGTVYMRLKELGLSNFYADGAAGFERWLRFLLKPENAPLLANAYTPQVAGWIGFMSWRFMRLACHGFEGAAGGIATTAQATDFIGKHFMLSHVLRQENLRGGLAQLVQGPLAASIKDVPAALQWLADARPVNASAQAAGVQALPVSQALRQRVRQREAILYNNYYPLQQESQPHAA